jgi:two-component system, OmpR family, phosphate regulon sensor histidine kinase PhoR
VALGRTLTSPVARLREHALAVGRGTLDLHVEVARPQELKALADAFNRMTDEVKAREEQREDDLSTISHDLRTPLSVIRGHAQLLLRDARKAQPTGLESGYAQMILTQADRMSAMIQELIESSRLEAGQMQLHPVAVDLHSFVIDLKERFATALETERIHVDATDDLPAVMADPEHLERILLNLLSNALKYSPSDSKICVRFYQTDAEVVTTVADSGFGIAQDELPHLFQRYQRTASARAQQEGLGLGLYITRVLVEAHGGRIWVESEKGKGSTFSFALPAQLSIARPSVERDAVASQLLAGACETRAA